jgi:hypothetical protein
MNMFQVHYLDNMLEVVFDCMDDNENFDVVD